MGAHRDPAEQHATDRKYNGRHKHTEAVATAPVIEQRASRLRTAPYTTTKKEETK